MRILAILTRPASAPRVPTQEEMERSGALIAELAAAGALVDAGGTWPGLLEMKVERRGDAYSIVDGPFAEAKEVIGGYLLVDVADRDAAIALMRRFLATSGDGKCHLHEIFEAPPET